MPIILSTIDLSDGRDARCQLGDGSICVLHLPSGATEEAFLAVGAAEEIRRNAEAAEAEILACMDLVRTGENPITFAWQLQTQTTGLQQVFRRFLAEGQEELVGIAPAVAGFTPAVFARLTGISEETAAAIIAWAQGNVAAQAAQVGLVSQISAEIGG